MDSSYLIDLVRQAIMLTLKISAPVMIIALLVGLAIGLLQALTQIQEMTLAFVPKIIIVFLSLFVLLPFMTNALIEFMHVLADQIAHISMSGG